MGEKRAKDHEFQSLSKSLLSVDSKNDTSHHESSRSASLEQQQASFPRQLEEYYNLIRKLLSVIDAYQDSLEISRHLRIRNGVVSVHSAEAVLFQDTHGHAARQLFDDSFFKFKDPWGPQAEDNSLCSSLNEADSEPPNSGSYVYRERDNYDHERPVRINRYIIPSDDRGDSTPSPDPERRARAIRRKADREESLSVLPYERDVDYDLPACRYDSEDERDYYEPVGRRRRSRARISSDTRSKATPTPPTTEDVVENPEIGEALGRAGALEKLILQWTNLTQEEVLEE